MTVSDQNADIEGVRADQLSELLARVEAAEGSDRYADCWLACALDGFFPVPKQWPERDRGMTWRVDLFRYEDGGDQMVRKYTGSLDQALALCERVLPGWLRDVRELPSGNWIAFVSTYEPARLFDATCRSPPLALLSAMLKALLDTKENP